MTVHICAALATSCDGGWTIKALSWDSAPTGAPPLYPQPLLHLDHSRVSRNPHPPEYWVTRAVSQEPHIFPTIPHACELPGWEYLLWKNGGGRWCRSRGSKCCHLASHMVFRSVLKGVLAVDWLIFRMQQKLLKLWKKSQVFPNNLKMEWYMWFLCYVKGWGIYEACKSWIGQKSFSGSKQDKMALIEYRSALLKIFRVNPTQYSDTLCMKDGLIGLELRLWSTKPVDGCFCVLPYIET